MTDPIVRFRDFSTSPEPVRFKVNDDIFECIAEIPLDGLAQMTQISAATDGGPAAMLSKVYDFFDSIMTPDSAALFRDRGRVGTKEQPNPNPIGMRAVNDILPWLMEVYGLRPTQPSDESSGGSGTDDISSTDGA
jgi:hypothetical protein